MKATSLFLSFTLLGTGCTFETVTTDIQVREPGRAALLRTDAKGTVRLPLPADGRVTLDAPARASITLGSPSTVARWCTPITREPRGQTLKFAIVADPKCVDVPTPGTIAYTLTADWRDVRVVERHRPQREGARDSIFLTTGIYGALAVVFFLLPPIGGTLALGYTLGGITAGVGVGLDAAWAPTVFTPDTDVLIHDFGPRG